MYRLAEHLSQITCCQKTDNKQVYLTFDDGPHPIITPWVLDLLKAFHAKATFFCIGANIKKYPEIFQQIKNEGHAIGNHSYNHEHGWKTSLKEYITSVENCQEHTQTKLFRPPYGKMSLAQYKYIKKEWNIILWNVLTEDYNQKKTPADCFKIIQKKTTKGSILVFHDSEKAWKNLEKLLPLSLEYFSDQGYSFKALEQF